jgi:hypothetical protein
VTACDIVTAVRACGLPGGSVAKGMTKISYKGYRFSPDHAEIGYGVPQTHAGDPLHRTQSRNGQIHHDFPLYRQVTLMWNWFDTGEI